MTAPQVNPAYIFAAGHGHCGAQSDLAATYCSHAEAIAEENPDLAAEYFTAAELFAELAGSHGRPCDLAILAGIHAVRSIHSAARDPVRSLEYREQAEELFESVEGTRDSHAMAIIVFALDKLADADPDDDRAGDRLNRIVEALPAGEAQLLREAARNEPAARETQEQG